MPLVSTVTIIEALRSHLTALPAIPAQPDGEKLFGRVGYFGANRLAEAMKSVFAIEQRVCFIVPGGDTHEGKVEGRHLLTKRTTRLALLIADRSLADRDAALTGMLELKDRVVRELSEEPAAGLCFEPGEGEAIVIESKDAPAGTIGRECWLQWFSIPAGTGRAVIRV
ncbi:MAG TPA: hypothetical protein VK163_06590 [Opitutaceae bacterium]|nr:hypothetical protein [Opitutaceae bacterium]